VDSPRSGQYQLLDWEGEGSGGEGVRGRHFRDFDGG